jgi:hypothetical protein
LAFIIKIASLFTGKRMKRIFAIVLVCVSVLSAQNTYEFLRLDTSPRAAAVAGSYVATGDDPNVMFYNPAGINSLQGMPASFSFLKHLMDINAASFAISKEYAGLGRFSAGFKYINYGTFTKADASGNDLGTFGAGDLALVFGYGNQLDQNFYYGANVKLIYSGIDDVSSMGVAVDLGLQYVIPESNWTFGFSALNLGSQIKSYYTIKEELPVDVRVGFSKSLEKLPLKFFWSFNKINEQQDNILKRFSNITFGGEFRLGQSLRLRIGYDNEKRKELRIGASAGLAGFSLGFGFIVKGYNVDYAFSSMGSIGSLHRFGISTNL